MEKEIEIQFSQGMMMTILVLLVVTVFGFIYWSVTMSSPTLFGDEGGHAFMTEWMADHMEIPVYSPLGYTTVYQSANIRVPFTYLLYGGFYKLFGEGFISFMIPLMGLFGAMFIFLAVKRIYSTFSALFASFFYLALPAVVTYNTLLYVDNVLCFLFAAFIYGYVRFMEKKEMRFVVFSGAMIGLMLLTKQTAIVMYPLILALFLVDKKRLNHIKSFLSGNGLNHLKLIFTDKENMSDFKLFVLIFLVASVVGGSWFIREFVLYGGPGEYDFIGMGKYFWGETPPGLISKVGGLEATGTNAELFQAGLIVFIDFAYGLIPFLLFIAGLVLFSYRRNSWDLVFLSMLLVIFVPIFYMGYSFRMEDLSRYILPVAVVMSIMAGEYIGNFFETFWKSHEKNMVKYVKKGIALAFIVLILMYTVPQVVAKANTMKSGIVKSFGCFVPQDLSFICVYNKDTKLCECGNGEKINNGFINGMNWIKMNTPANSTLFSLWAYQTAYLTKRNVVWGIPEWQEILLNNTDASTIPLLKRNGIDYIVVAKGSIRTENVAVSYPLSFVQYLDSSKYFNKTLENNGVIIYRVI